METMRSADSKMQDIGVARPTPPIAEDPEAISSPATRPLQRTPTKVASSGKHGADGFGIASRETVLRCRLNSWLS